jgi:hypothetical protein
MNIAVVIPVALVTLIALTWWYRRSRDNQRFALQAARPGATVCSRAELIDGGRHIPVALTLDPKQVVYQSNSFDASIDIGMIDEVEYGTDLVTGAIAHGAVLRLRSHGRAIEFVLDKAAAELWSRSLPAHRMEA